MAQIVKVFILTISLSGVCFSQSISRQVISSAGTSTDSGGFSISYTVGQPAAYLTYSAQDRVLTQGFQQPDGTYTRLNQSPSYPVLSQTGVEPEHNRLIQVGYPPVQDTLDQTTRFPIRKDDKSFKAWYASYSDRLFSSIEKYWGDAHLTLRNANSQILWQGDRILKAPNFLDLELPYNKLPQGTYFLTIKGTNKDGEEISASYIFKIFGI